MKEPLVKQDLERDSVIETCIREEFDNFIEVTHYKSSID